MNRTEKEKAEFDQLYHVLTSLAQKGKPVSSEELKHVMKGSSMTRKRHPSVHLQLQAQALGLPQVQPQVQPQAQPQVQPQAPPSSQSQEPSEEPASHESRDLRKKYKKKQPLIGKTIVVEDSPDSTAAAPAQHLLQDILRMAEARQISKRDLWDAMKKEWAEEVCDACHGSFADRESLTDHIEHSPLCQRWRTFTPHDQCRTLQGPLPVFLEDCLEKAIIADPCQCHTCLCRFPTKEALYQHLSAPSALLCNRYACYELKKMIARI